MMRKFLLAVLCVFIGCFVAGCSDSQTDNEKPIYEGPSDEEIVEPSDEEDSTSGEANNNDSSVRPTLPEQGWTDVRK